MSKCNEKQSISLDIHEVHQNDLFHKDNIAIAATYFSVGFVGAFLATPLNIYLVEKLNAEPSQQNTISILSSLPWSLKLLFGFLSDSCPIRGMHRKPYLSMGALAYSLAFLFYSSIPDDNIVVLASCIFTGTLGLICFDVMADAMSVERSRFEENSIRGQMQSSCYSIRFFGSLLGAILGTIVTNKDTWGWGMTFKQVCFTNGFIPLLLILPWLSCLKEKYQNNNHHKNNDDASDEDEEYESVSLLTKSNENSHDNHNVIPIAYQTQHLNSSTQDKTTNNNDDEDDNNNENILIEMQPFGVGARREIVVASTVTATHHHHNHSNTNSHKQPQSPNKKQDDGKTHTITKNKEEAVSSNLSVSRQLNDIWDTVQLKAVWKPMAFVYIYNILQIPNVAWQSFLQLSLHFEPWILGLTATLGCLMTLLGVLAYKYWFFKASWKSVYIWSTLLTAVFSLLQLVLIFQWNQTYFHINNYFFSLGDDVISAYISGIQFLPVCIMYMRLCPEGSEGASYAMLTTFGNIALVCASSIGNRLSTIWDVSNDAMRHHNITGLWRLTVLTSTLAVLPLMFLSLLPTDSHEQEKLSKSKEKSSIGGCVFLIVLFGSLTWTVSNSIASLYH